MRIIHVADVYAPRTGGIETQVRDLARGQVRAGAVVHVLTATPGPDGHGVVEVDEGVSVHRMGVPLPMDLPVNPAATRRIVDVVQEVRPDVVHVHAGLVSPFAFEGARAALRVGVPVAITWHCMLNGVVTLMRAGIRVTDWSRAPVALSAVSDAAADRVRYVFGREVRVVPNGVDLSAWAPRGPRDRAPGPVRAVATMRLAPRKRAGALLRVLARATEQLPAGALTLDLVGEGLLAPHLRRRADRLGLSDVIRFHGRLSGPQLRSLYDDADVFLAPAQLEAFGIAGLEARAAGLVVVGRSGTGLTEYLTHDHDGLLVDDDQAMSRALVALVQEPGRLARLRGAARSERPVHGWDLTLSAAAAEYERARGLRLAAGPEARGA